MSAWVVRARLAALMLCLPVLTGACGGASKPSTPTSPVLPANGPCQAATGLSRSLVPIVNGSACDSTTSSVVMLVIRQADGVSVSRCSGAVIGSQAVLTAAHCVFGNPIRVTVVPGDAPDITAQTFAAHPEYRPSPYPLDIAVITTSRPIGRRAIPLLVSRPGRVGETGVLAGWGVDQNGDSGMLRAGVAAIDFVGDTFLTTRFSASETGTCSGDSGGPLLLSESGEWMLAGVASTGVYNPATNAPPCQNGISVYAGVRAVTISSFIRGLVPDASLR